jgi:tripartite-type tricarboxylate transporter receptor subunit TctC
LKFLYCSLRTALLASMFFAGTASAQAADPSIQYPSKTIHFVVPVAPGGLTDILGRALAERLQKRLGQTVVVENKGGAGGVVGTVAVASAPADGHTLLMTFLGPAAVRQALGSNTPYDTLRDFVPVSAVAQFSMLLVVGSDLPVKNLAEFIDLAKSKPGELSYASAGVGSTANLVGELFKRDAGVDLLHTPYKGEAAGMIDVIAGRVSSAWMSSSVAQPQIEQGKLRVLGIANKERHSGTPDIPTIAEGGVEGFNFAGWYGVLVPAGTPQPIVEKLSKEFQSIVNDPEMTSIYAKYGIDQYAHGQEHFDSLIKEEIQKWRQLGADTGFKLD